MNRQPYLVWQVADEGRVFRPRLHLADQPDTSSDVWQAGSSGQEAVELLYGQLMQRTLTDREASSLLSVISFTRVLAKFAFPSGSGAEVTLAMRGIAAFISNQPDLWSLAVRLGGDQSLARKPWHWLCRQVGPAFLRRIDRFLEALSADVHDAQMRAPAGTKLPSMKGRSTLSPSQRRVNVESKPTVELFA